MIYNQEKEIKRFWIYLVVILLSLITTLGFTLDAVPEQITIIKYIKEHINGILLLLAISVFCYGVAIPLVFKKIDAATLISKKSTESGDDYIFAKCHCFKYIAIIFLCWLPYLIITYPAITVGYDFFWQLLQGVGAFPLSNHHPVLGSIIYGVIYSIGYELGGATFGLFLISFLQMLLMTSVLGLGISLLVDMGIVTIGCISLFFASLNSRKLQAKMANFASPFWRKLQAAQQGFLARHEQHCRHAIEIISIAAFVPDDQRCFCKSC